MGHQINAMDTNFLCRGQPLREIYHYPV